MNTGKQPFIYNIAVILLTLTVIVCYYEYEVGICNYYRIPLFIFKSPALLIFIALSGFAIISSIVKSYPGLIIKVCGLANDVPRRISKSLIFLVLVGLILLSHYAGFKRAGMKTEYAVSANNKNSYWYGPMAICVF
jgi:hypothetical protein